MKRREHDEISVRRISGGFPGVEVSLIQNVLI